MLTLWIKNIIKMKNAYHHDIMTMLTRSGIEGMNVRQIARLLYNEYAGFFEQDVVYEKIYNSVRRYLWGQSKMRRSPIIWLRRGQYGLRQDAAVQLDFLIDLVKDEEIEPEKHSAVSVTQLELF